jgi:DNA-binding phage protein
MKTFERNIDQLVDAVYEEGLKDGESRDEIERLWRSFDERSRKAMGFSPFDYDKPEDVTWPTYITHILRMCHATDGIQQLMEETRGEFTNEKIIEALDSNATPLHAVVLRLIPMLLFAFKDMGMEVLRHKLSDWEGEDDRLWGSRVFDDVSNCVDGAYERLFAAAIASGYDIPVPEHMKELAADATKAFEKWGGADVLPSEELN